MVINDNRIVNKDIILEQDKTIYHIINRGVLICKIKEIIQQVDNNFKFELVIKHKNKQYQFELDLLIQQIKDYDERARKIIEEMI